MMKNKMTFDEYKQYIKACVKEYLPEEYQNREVTLTTNTKNNGVVLTGISIFDEERLTPTVYINDSYERYREGVPVESILENLAESYMEAVRNRSYAIPGTVDELIQMLSTYEEVKGKILPRVCNTRENADRLLECPHTIFNDLAVTYHVILTEGAEGKSTVRITNDLFAGYGISKEEFHEQAMENLKERGYQIVSLEETIYTATISKLMNDFDVTYEEAEVLARNVYDMKEGSGLYVLSSKDRDQGAVWMLSDEVMKEIADYLGEDYYVLPSSTHEVLVVPKSMEIPPQELKEMVKNVNHHSVALEERLSDNVYEYDSKEKKLQLVTPEKTYEHEHEKEQSITK